MHWAKTLFEVELGSTFTQIFQSTIKSQTIDYATMYSIFDHSGGYSTGKLGQIAGDTN